MKVEDAVSSFRLKNTRDQISETAIRLADLNINNIDERRRLIEMFDNLLHAIGTLMHHTGNIGDRRVYALLYNIVETQISIDSWVRNNERTMDMEILRVLAMFSTHSKETITLLEWAKNETL